MRKRPARSIILVLDENLSGKIILNGLRDVQVSVKPQTDFIQQGAKDAAVFEALAPHRDCYLLTKDSKFHRKPAEKAALIEHRIGAFVITSQKNKTGPELVVLISRAWPRIERFARKNRRPFIAKILAEGRIEKIRWTR